ncbi:unnamed protein product [Mytilus coruscus]|uniref:Uncharacterized protein n=1 Tax=Mytilus coruscus TaxID=42192 RepID=A0A6J8A450_MYTCO|nr:unnamed protein product [Mytilus coruscus]
MATGVAVRKLTNGTGECTLCSSVSGYGETVIFCDSGSNQVKEIIGPSVRVVTGTGQIGNDNGPCDKASFSQLFSLCTEMKNIFVCDAQTGCVKVISDMKGSVRFLTHLKLLYQAFGVHFKHQNVERANLEEAKDMVRRLSDYLHETIRSVQVILDTDRQRNGPDGTISSKILKSVDMIHSELGYLQSQITSVNSSIPINMLSCLTVCVENLHALGHFKCQLPTMFEHARNLSNTVYEGIKRSVLWAAYYFTHPSSHYPIPENDMPLSSLSAMEHLKPKALLSKDQERVSGPRTLESVFDKDQYDSKRQCTTLAHYHLICTKMQLTVPQVNKSHFLQYLKKVSRTTIKFLNMIENQMWTTLKKRTMLLTPQNVLVFFKGQPAGVGEQSGSAVNFIDKINIYTI